MMVKTYIEEIIMDAGYFIPLFSVLSDLVVLPWFLT